MKIAEFAMERMQSTWENRVDLNLAESGVRPLLLEELVDDDEGRRALLGQPLRYTQSNGTPALRDAIANLYPGAGVDHVQVTNGGSEANFITMLRIVEPGEEVVMMTPNYMQAWGLARGFGGTVREWPLAGGPAADGTVSPWRVDGEALERIVSPRTKLIVLCNPNNPTGARIEAADLDRICAVAARHGAWLLSDEIYRGAERDGRDTPSAWGRYDRVIVTSGLSKAYGLPGLRIGWIVAPPPLVASLWAYHDYTTISPGALSDWLARRALGPDWRPRLLARTRGILNANYPVIASWLDRASARAGRGGQLRHAPPDAGAIVYVRYAQPINSTVLVTRLREEQSVLIVPGDHFGMDGYLRIGFGEATAALDAGLERLGSVLASLAQPA